MSATPEELARRRPIWVALSELFLDTELSEATCRAIARDVRASEYSPEEIQRILWDEVYPVLEANLREPAGVWDGFDTTWLERQILGSRGRPAPRRHRMTERIVRDGWAQVLKFVAD